MFKLGLKRLLDAATGTGAGSSLALTRQGILNHTIQVLTTGSPTAVVVALEGSIDGSNWFELASHTFSAGEITAGKAMFHVTGRFVKHVRANLTTLTGGTSPTVTVEYTGDAISKA